MLPEIAANDLATLLPQVFDAGSLIELKAEYETGVKTVLGRVGGHSVGVVATAEGTLTAGALQKAARPTPLWLRSTATPTWLPTPTLQRT